jgi:hypothetical protein
VEDPDRRELDAPIQRAEEPPAVAGPVHEPTNLEQRAVEADEPMRGDALGYHMYAAYTE